jgi:predicted AlkP superfamily phosphohydrolase/phosphomutase
MPKVAAIGIDAAEYGWVERLMATGQLPNLRALAARSARFRLETVAKYRSDLAWVRFLTGRSEESLGWHGLMEFDPQTYLVEGHGTLEATPFYALADRRTVVFDVPGSVIDAAVEGVQVTAWGAHSPQWWRASRPPGLLREIDTRFGTNPTFGNDFDISWHEPGRIEALSAATRVGSQRRVDALQWLAESNPDWDLLLTTVSEVHSMGHLFWFGVDDTHPLHGRAATTDLAGQALVDTLVATDEAVGRLVDGLPPDTTVVVFALHGMQPADDVAATVLLPELLHRLHLGRSALRAGDPQAWRAAGCPPALLAPGTPWHRYVRDRFHDGPGDLVRRLGRLAPPGVYGLARRAAGKPALHDPAQLVATTPPETDLATAGAWRHQDIDWSVVSWYRRHWPAMPWFAIPTFDDALLRINLAGRESRGVVPAEGYVRACADASAFVRALRDARTGEPAVAEVTLLRASDPFDPQGPNADVLVRWQGAPDALVHPTLGMVGPVPHARTGAHSANGFALVAGPGIDPGDRGVRPAADLPPTLVALMGADAPEVEGTPLILPTGP